MNHVARADDRVCADRLSVGAYGVYAASLVLDPPYGRVEQELNAEVRPQTR